MSNIALFTEQRTFNRLHEERGKKMKKNLSVLLVIAMVAAFCFTTAGCKSESKENNITIGIVQIVEHKSLDEIRENIISELAEEGYVDGKNITIDYKNAQNDTNNLKTICQTFAANNVDLIIAIATPSAQSALGETKDIPIVFAAVTDPVAAGLVKDMNNPGGNITGTSDAVSAAKIMDLAMKITPDIKTIGALYNSSETNSVSVINDLKKYASTNGLKVIEGTVTNTSEVQQAAQYLAGKADVVFSPIDNTIASAMPVVTKVLNAAKIPFYVGADSMVSDGALATYGIDYAVLGKETGKMVGKVLNGTDIGSISVMTMSDMKIYVNTTTAKTIGTTIPDSILKDAEDLGLEK